MGKKKKQKLLTSDLYRSLEKLRTVNGVVSIGKSKRKCRNDLLYEMAETRELGFNFPSVDDMHACESYANMNPEFAKCFGGIVDKHYLRMDVQRERMKQNDSWSKLFALHTYIDTSQTEFYDWLDAYKFEIDWGSIEDILPTGQKMEDMFGHLETRLPYDHCLYIGKVNKDLTIYFKLSQQPISEAIDAYTKQRSEGQLSPSLVEELGYSDEEYERIMHHDWGGADNGGADNAYDKEQGLLPIIHRWESQGVESIARANTSISYKGRFVFNPISAVLPLGITIQEMSTVGKDDTGYELALLSDRFLHPTHDVTWAEKALTDNEYPDDPKKSSFHSVMGIEVLKYATVFLDPQFREFAVKEELHQGMPPEFIKQSQIIKHTTPIKTSGADRPKFEHRVLTLNIPKNVVNPRGKGNRKEGTRLHSVRGHMLKTAKGKYVWRKAHWRGKEKFGVIKKEYKLPKQKAS